MLWVLTLSYVKKTHTGLLFGRSVVQIGVSGEGLGELKRDCCFDLRRKLFISWGQATSDRML